MPVEIGFWKINGTKVDKINYTVIETEEKLEDILENDISILRDDLLLIGRQVLTKHGKYIDILAIDIEGNLSIIELKKNKTSRTVVSQTIDYASWVQDLTFDNIINIYSENNNNDLESDFYEKFETELPEKINQSHSIMIVAAEIDNETERIINYLSDNYDVPINAVFFRYFTENDNEYLSRSWLIDPDIVEEKASVSLDKNKTEKWNGKDFVVNIEDDEPIFWEDCIQYNCVIGGGGKWYSRTLKKLFPGARIFVMIPKNGYVGVGEVIEKAVPAKEFKVNHGGKLKSILDVPTKGNNLDYEINNLDKCYYFVKIDWIKTNSVEDAYWEKGLRANQNTAFKLKSKFTIEKLTKFFDLDE
ncbi:MAG: DUF91 domain-containing protein [Bacillota bacterium]